MKVLVTGGAGYIGSTICSALLDTGHTPIIIDSLVRGDESFTKDRIFYNADIADVDALAQIFSEHPDIDVVVHCAGFIFVPESVEKPFEYYMNNVAKSAIFFNEILKHGCNKVLFSSTASLYGSTDGSMVTEQTPVAPNSPYAKTKLMIEMMLEDFSAAYGLEAVSLRYFNPIGADPQMRTGSYDKNPSHLLGSLIKASNSGNVFSITGTNWPTRDGSGIRDYLHVWDLALAHVKAVQGFDAILEKVQSKTATINLGTGDGVTVIEFVGMFENVLGHTINKQYTDPREGDVAGAYANAETAATLIGWKAETTIESGIRDALAWDKVFSER